MIYLCRSKTYPYHIQKGPHVSQHVNMIEINRNRIRVREVEEPTIVKHYLRNNNATDFPKNYDEKRTWVFHQTKGSSIAENADKILDIIKTFSTKNTEEEGEMEKEDMEGIQELL